MDAHLKNMLKSLVQKFFDDGGLSYCDSLNQADIDAVKTGIDNQANNDLVDNFEANFDRVTVNNADTSAKAHIDTYFTGGDALSSDDQKLLLTVVLQSL